MSLGFADAISPSGKGLRKKDLAGAYRKAGTAFVGQMQQTFVVLHKRNGSGLELTTPERKKNLREKTRKGKRETQERPKGQKMEF